MAEPKHVALSGRILVEQPELEAEARFRQLNGRPMPPLRDPQLPYIQYAPYEPAPPPSPESIKQLLPPLTTASSSEEDELAALMSSVSIERSQQARKFEPTEGLWSYEVEPRMIVANNPSWVAKYMPNSELSLRFLDQATGKPIPILQLLDKYHLLVKSKSVYTPSLGPYENLLGSDDNNPTVEDLTVQLPPTAEDVAKNRLRVKLVPDLTENQFYILNEDNNSYMSFLLLRFMIHARLLDRQRSVAFGTESYNNIITMLFSVQPLSFLPVNSVIPCGSLETATTFLRTHLVSYMDMPLVAPYLYAYRSTLLSTNLLSGRDRFGAHLMHWFAAKGLPQALRVLLLHYNLSPDQLDQMYATPLSYALASAQWRTAVILLSEGADPFIANRMNGFSPWAYAMSHVPTGTTYEEFRKQLEYEFFLKATQSQT